MLAIAASYGDAPAIEIGDAFGQLAAIQHGRLGRLQHTSAQEFRNVL
jgi:hypothetical protein